MFLSEKRNLLFRRDYAYPKNKRTLLNILYSDELTSLKMQTMK